MEEKKNGCKNCAVGLGYFLFFLPLPLFSLFCVSSNCKTYPPSRGKTNKVKEKNQNKTADVDGH
jgi:hypothetical protein